MQKLIDILKPGSIKGNSLSLAKTVFIESPLRSVDLVVGPLLFCVCCMPALVGQYCPNPMKSHLLIRSSSVNECPTNKASHTLSKPRSKRET